MTPVDSNVLNKSCDNPISSNCVTYVGPPVPGTTICKGASITDVIYQVGVNASSETGEFAPGHQSCYTRNWVDFSSSIPLSGIISGFTYTISAFGSGFFSSNPYYKPSYKWTKDGDLYLRGGFAITISSLIKQASGNIPLMTIPVSCTPTNWTATETQLVSVFFDTADSQVVDKVGSGSLTLDYPSGILYLNLLFIDISLGSFVVYVDIGTRFNIA